MTTAPQQELVGLIEVAALCGVKTDTAYRWRSRNVLPAPGWTLSGRPVWDRAVIEAWAKATGRLP